MLRDENPEPEIYPLILGLDGRAWRHSEAANADADHGRSAADGSERRLRLATDIGYGGSGCGMARAATTAAAPSAVLALAFFCGLPTTTSLLKRERYGGLGRSRYHLVREPGPDEVRE